MAGNVCKAESSFASYDQLCVLCPKLICGILFYANQQMSSNKSEYNNCDF